MSLLSICVRYHRRFRLSYMSETKCTGGDDFSVPVLCMDKSASNW